MNLAGIILLLLLQAAEPAAKPEFPAMSGAYYRHDDVKWVEMKPAPVTETKTKGMGLFIESGGYSNLGVNLVCRGAKALLRIPNPKPTFFVRGVGFPTDAMLVRLTQKRNKRVFQTSSLNATVENKGGFRKGDIYRVAVNVNPDKSFSVTPEDNLKPGEYLLVIGYATAGFDFGID